jgi:hypothetical protein
MSKIIKTFLQKYIMGKVRSVKLKIKQNIKWKEFKKKIKIILKNKINVVKSLTETAISIIIYGTMINWITYIFLGKPINLMTIIAYGMIFYFIKVEIPPIITSSIPIRRR